MHAPGAVSGALALGPAAGFLLAWGLAAHQRCALRAAELRAQRAQAEATRLSAACDAILESWGRAVALRGGDSPEHTRRVTGLAVALARRLNLPEEQISHLRRGAVLHDIGNLSVGEGVLLKPGRLTEEEWAIVRGHPAAGAALLHEVEMLRPALDVVLCHHERWDGSGYPHGLQGDEIPLLARIFALADVWDALRKDQPYRAAWPEEAIRTYIAQQSGKQFDPAVSAVFLEMMAG